MQKITLFAAFALVALLSSQAIAASPTGLYDIVFGSVTTSISVKATNVKTQKMTVQILNENEEYLVNQDFTNREDFIKTYELAQLKDGEYKMIILKRDRRITQPFSIDGGYVQLTELEKQTTYFPVVNVRKKHFDVNLFSEKYGDITVNILNEQDVAVYTNTVSDVHKMHQRYDTKDLPRGSYTVEVIVNGEAFYYDLEK